MSEETINIGGMPYTVSRWKTYKAVLMGEILKKVSKEVRDLFKEASAFTAEYKKNNTLSVTRQLCRERALALHNSASALRVMADEDPSEGEERLPPDDLRERAQQLDDQAQGWEDQLADMDARGLDVIELPQEPSEFELIMALFPAAFDMRRQLTQILALLVTPDSELRISWRKDTVLSELSDKGEHLLENSEPEEIVNLGIMAKRVVGDQFRPLMPAVKTLWQAEDEPETIEAETTSPSPPPPAPTPQPAPPTPPPPPTSSSPTSSTSSPALTGGASRTSGSESPGDSPSPSNGA